MQNWQEKQKQSISTGLVLQPPHIHVHVHINKCIYLNGLYDNVIVIFNSESLERYDVILASLVVFRKWAKRQCNIMNDVFNHLHFMIFFLII